MKKILILLLAILFCWNMYLTVSVNNFKSGNQTSINRVEKTVTGFSTDLTAVVASSESKVVGIMSVVNGKSSPVGSGIVYDLVGKEVIIVTNQHVVDNVSSIRVLFNNGIEIEAQVIGTDKWTDLAVLKAAVDFKVTPFTATDSSLNKKGEWVIAMGNPYSVTLSGTVTVGVISGVDRLLSVDTDDDGVTDWEMVYIQTDAAINKGNSGGPLINMEGELVGINTMKKQGEDNLGISFAIPANELEPIVAQILEKGSVTRPNLGVTLLDIQTMTIYQKSFYNISIDLINGLLVTNVAEDSLSKHVGVQSGDIITKIDNLEIDNLGDYRKVIYDKKSTDTIELTLMRNGVEMKVMITLE